MCWHGWYWGRKPNQHKGLCSLYVAAGIISGDVGLVVAISKRVGVYLPAAQGIEQYLRFGESARIIEHRGGIVRIIECEKHGIVIVSGGTETTVCEVNRIYEGVEVVIAYAAGLEPVFSSGGCLHGRGVLVLLQMQEAIQIWLWRPGCAKYLATD